MERTHNVTLLYTPHRSAAVKSNTLKRSFPPLRLKRAPLCNYTQQTGCQSETLSFFPECFACSIVHSYLRIVLHQWS